MKRKTYPLRINPEILAAMQTWANDDLRSVNAQIEFVLRESLSRAGRYKAQAVTVKDTEEKEKEKDKD